MAKKETSPELTEEFKKTLAMTNMIDVEVDDELKKSFIAYAMAVNVSRAIPDVRDGLKPVHRRILYSMHEMGLYNDKAYRKCARIVGDVLGKYHPHGDRAVYDALVRLAQDFTINFPLVDGHGNFGSASAPSTATRPRQCVIPRRGCPNSRRKCCATWIKRRSIIIRHSTTRECSRAFYPHDSRTCS